jgi:phospholipase/lecithinase/hemolysin
MKFRTSAVVVATAVLAAVTLSTPRAASRPYSHIVVFGTSLSDPGNAFALRGAANTPPDYLVDPLLVPSAPYARGGHHFSNGATWVERFARSNGLAGSVRPAYASESGATNYAVGGARAREDFTNVNLGQQVEAFLQQQGGVAPSDALYVIEMGGNDIRDALVAFGSGGAPAVLQAAIAAIQASVETLHAAGARNFLIWRAPNVALTPAIRQLGPGAIQVGTFLSRNFNGGLDGVVVVLKRDLPGITIARLDADRLLNDLIADGPSFGLTEVRTPCLTPYVAPFTCGTPDEFLFWDGIHPSAAVHAIIAQEAATVLMQ